MDPVQDRSEFRPRLVRQRRERQDETILRLLRKHAEAHSWRSLDGDPWVSYGSSDPGDHFEHWPLIVGRGHGINMPRRFAAHLFQTEMGGLPDPTALSRAMDALIDEALFGRDKRPVYLRRAQHGDSIYLDMCDDLWRAIRIDERGVEVTQGCPVMFRRVKGMGPLPEPVLGGTLDGFRRLTHMSDDNWTRFCSHVLQFLMPEGPYYILEITGEAGSSKSWLAWLAKMTVDPDIKNPLRRPPKDDEDLFVGAVNSALLVFDNQRPIKSEFSDSLCVLSTGGGMRARERYTVNQESVTDACLPIILTGITPLASSADLQSREIPMVLDPIPDSERRTVKELKAAFQLEHPIALGAFCTAAQAALQSQGKGNVVELDRMADARAWIEGGLPSLGFEPGAFTRVQNDSKADADQRAVDASPIGAQIRQLAQECQSWGPGTASALLNEVRRLNPDATKNPRFPKTPGKFAEELNNITQPLRALGVDASREREPGTGAKLWMIRKCALRGEIASQASQASHPLDCEYKNEHLSVTHPPPRGPSQSVTPPLIAAVDEDDDPASGWLESLEEHRPIDMEDEDGDEGRPASQGPDPGDPPSGPERRPDTHGSDRAPGPGGEGGDDPDRGGDRGADTGARGAAPPPRPYAAGGPDHTRPWSNPRAGSARPRNGLAEPDFRRRFVGPPQRPPRGPSDPGATITIMGPGDGFLASLDYVAAHPRQGLQLWIAGRPGTDLGFREDRLTRLIMPCPAIEEAQAAGWTFTRFEKPGLTSWSRAHHRTLGDRYIDVVIPQFDETLQFLCRLDAAQLRETLQEYTRLMGVRMANSPGWVWRHLVEEQGPLNPGSRLPLPAGHSQDWGDDHAVVLQPTWEREPTEEEWGRRWAWALDRSGAYLGAFAGFDVGFGEVQIDGEQTKAWGRSSPLPGYTWVEILKDPMAERGLPPILDQEAGWVTHETLSLLQRTAATYRTGPHELWTRVGRPFQKTQQKVSKIRSSLIGRTDPVGVALRELVKRTYSQGAALMTSKRVRSDSFWRPDVYESLIARSRANLQWSLWKAPATANRPVCYLDKDTCIWFSDQETPEGVAKEAGIRHGNALGSWHAMGRVPLEELKERRKGQAGWPLHSLLGTVAFRGL